MKRHVTLVLFSLLISPMGFGEVIASAGGAIGIDLSSPSSASPTVEATMTGDHTWTPGDRLGFFLDWSAGGSYAPLSGASAGLATVSTGASYIAGGYLAKLQLGGVANPTTDEGFYGAATVDALLSYGSFERSFFVRPRLSAVVDPSAALRAGGELGGVLLAAPDTLIKLTVEGETALAAPLGQDWYLSPGLSLDWYPAGRLTLGLRIAYARSTSAALSQLVTGGPLLPLDRWERYTARIEGSLVVGERGLLSLELPVDFYRKGYDAFDGATDLGVAAWLLATAPLARLRLPLSSSQSKSGSSTLITSAGFDGALSNNLVEQRAAPFFSLSFELKLPGRS